MSSKLSAPHVLTDVDQHGDHFDRPLSIIQRMATDVSSPPL